VDAPISQAFVLLPATVWPARGRSHSLN